MLYHCTVSHTQLILLLSRSCYITKGGKKWGDNYPTEILTDEQQMEDSTVLIKLKTKSEAAQIL